LTATLPTTIRSTGRDLVHVDQRRDAGGDRPVSSLTGISTEVLRVEQEERLRFCQLRDGHVNELALLQRQEPYRILGAVGNGLDDAGIFPRRQGG
jgi:hypothetical protein